MTKFTGMKENLAINIGRQFGSGGRLIGEKLAKELQFSFYDKELINIASKKSGLGKEFFEEADEKRRFGLSAGFLGLRTSILSDEFLHNYLSNETLFKIQSDVIRELAQQSPAVFVGRCADYILRDNPFCLNIFITADNSDRIVRVMERQNLSEEKVADLLEKTDKKRAGYYNYYTNKKWGAAKSYHLCLNSSLLGIEGSVQFIRRLAREKFGL